MEYQLPAPPVAAPNMGVHQVPVGVMQGTLNHVQTQEEPNRWTQYQQLWRQHVYINGMPDKDLLRIKIYLFYMGTVRIVFSRNGRKKAIIY